MTGANVAPSTSQWWRVRHRVSDSRRRLQPYRIPSESVAMNSLTVRTKSRRPSHSEGPRPCKVARPLMQLLFPTCELVEPRPDSAVAAAPPPGCCWIRCSHKFANHVDPSLPRLQTRHSAAPVTNCIIPRLVNTEAPAASMFSRDCLAA